jgi:quercetin dioxygenase-like cupin family protein
MSLGIAASVVIGLLVGGGSALASAQALGDAAAAKPVAGDPGISSMLVTEDEHVRILRDYAEPGATRRMHAHKDATFHVFTLLSGQLRLQVEGEKPVDVTAGEVVMLEGGVTHTFTNTGTVTATIVEVFGKARKP